MKIKDLFVKKWTNLLKDYGNLENCQFPGVYILAYTEKNLEGKPLDIKDIFYVGMSNSRGGVKQRLKQFINGIHKNHGHSAGNRFFKEYGKGEPFNILKDKKTFFVASLSLPCKVHKNKRSPEDLRKMGQVAKFEYEVLAYIKENLNREPELNKK